MLDVEFSNVKIKEKEIIKGTITEILPKYVVVDAKDFTEISEIKRKLKKGLEEDFGIDHSTLEFEHKDVDCDD